MRRLADVPRYARDLGEVLLLNRVSGSQIDRRAAQEAASVVRQTRFHAHARIPHVELTEIVESIAEQTITSVVVPGPMELEGVGNAGYYHALASLTAAVSPERVLEFGTYLGVGTLTIALNASPTCRIVTLDLPDEATGDELDGLNEADRTLVAVSRSRVGEAFRGTPFEDRIEQVRADSLYWQPDESMGPLDLAFIDGGHSTALVRADTEKALKLLARRGVIVWDDYFHLYPDVVTYLENLYDQGFPLVAVRGTNFVVYRTAIHVPAQ